MSNIKDVDLPRHAWHTPPFLLIVSPTPPVQFVDEHVRTDVARSITWQPNEKRLTILYEYGALSRAREARVGAPLKIPLIPSTSQWTPCWNWNRKSRFNALSACGWQLYPQGSLGATLIGPSAPTRFWVGKIGANQVWKVLRPAPYEIRWRTFLKVYKKWNCFRKTGLNSLNSYNCNIVTKMISRKYKFHVKKNADFFEPLEFLFGQIQYQESQLFFFG